MKFCIPVFFLALWCACTSKPSNVDSKQIVKAENFKMSAQLFNGIKKDTQNTNELLFQVGLVLSKEQFEKSKSLPNELQYGVDSAFVLLGKKDTIWPLYVMPVANGQSLAPQFIVAFDKSVLPKTESVELKTRIKSITTNNDPGVSFNLTKINSLYK